MKLVFVHGWGSGPFIWDKMIDEFNAHSCHVLNMGFLGQENMALPEEKFVGIGHSLGGAWLLKFRGWHAGRVYPDKVTSHLDSSMG